MLKLWFTAPLIAEPFISHWFPLEAEEVKVTFPPSQKVSGPPDIVGTEGTGLTVTLTVVLAGVHTPAVAVIVYVTTAGLPELLVMVWAITGPEPPLKPVADPDWSAAVHVNTEPVMLPRICISVVEPEQIVWEAGSVVTEGVCPGVTVTLFVLVQLPTVSVR